MKMKYQVSLHGPALKLHVYRWEVVHCSRSDNLRKAMIMAEEAVASGADLIVFPEVFSTGFCYEYMGTLAEEVPVSYNS